MCGDKKGKVELVFSMKREEKYSELFQFFGCYLNQDWDCWSDNLEGCVRAYLLGFESSEAAFKYIKQCYQELKELIKEEHDEKEWESIISIQLGCDYNYKYYGITVMQFLETVQDMMKKNAWEIRKVTLE